MSSTPSSTSTGDSRRRAEIEAKRAKLAELRRAREERSSRIHAGRTTSTGAAAVQSETDTPLSSHRKDLDDLVATLVGPSGTSSPRPRKSLQPEDGVVVGGGTEFSSPRKRGQASSSDYSFSDAAPPTSSTLVSRADGELVADHEQQQQQHGASAAARGMPDMIDVETELFEFPQKERVYYTKEVQTTAVSTSTDDDDEGTAGSLTAAPTEAVIRKKILEEQELARLSQQDKQAQEDEEEARLDKEIQEELRVMSPEEAQAIFGTTDFTDFVEQSSKIVERALTDTYDYLKDYTRLDSNAIDAQADSRRSIKTHRTFYDENLCKGRSITSLDWSVKHPELIVASYSRSGTVVDSPDGLVLVWNLHLAHRPEFIFHAQTDVLSVAFSPFHSNLVIGGTYSGQILIWDTTLRKSYLPILKSPLSAAGTHTHPVYNLQVVGTQNANHLITASTDGVVCSWMLDMLAQPQESLELLNSTHPKTDEVAVTCMGFPLQETTQFWLGTEEGNIYLGSRFDRAGSKAGLQTSEVYKGHSAPVTGLHFHSASVPLAASSSGGAGIVDFSDLFLTSSMDWTAKLWRIKGGHSTTNTNATTSNGNTTVAPAPTPSLPVSTSAANLAQHTHTRTEITPLLSFEETSDYVMDVQWHPVNPTIFALVDAHGATHIYNLIYDTERPLVTTHISQQGLNKVSFDRSNEGRHVAVGGLDGRVYVLDVGNVVRMDEGGEDAIELQRVLRGVAA